jgi:hypothetical protein
MFLNFPYEDVFLFFRTNFTGTSTHMVKGRPDFFAGSNLHGFMASSAAWSNIE